MDDELVAKATELTGITERTALVRQALEALVQQESARRLARLGGTDPKASAAPRRRGAVA
jgi:Arc/MetJ family transcription regulator